jgi:CDP-glucose 4,6-dehydratase
MGKDYSSTMENPLGQRLRDLPGPLLLTGHTGFKGTWMTFLLEYLNVPVVGYSLPAEKDSLYDRAERTGTIPEHLGDIRDYVALDKFIDLHKPSTIIHMAAQPLVLKSYESPRETFDVNVMGTVNVLDIAFKKDFVKAIIVVTTDKVYRNDDSGRAFVESDPLEGKDPYSASKVGTEAVVAAWQQISKVSGGPGVISVRAGNVVGGGDFAANRLIADLVRGYIRNENVVIRNLESTRPWQHVLDPLNGYLMTLESKVSGDKIDNANFGPSGKSMSVGDVVQIAKECLGERVSLIIDKKNENTSESKYLDLNSEKIRTETGWKPMLNQSEAIRSTFNWWLRFLNDNQKPENICRNDIEMFLNNRKVDEADE